MATRQQFISAVGSDLVAIGLPAGETRGIVIDNPSGSWLQLFPTYDYIAPYTIGWARPFDGAIASLDVKFVQGPSGQLSTTDGDPIKVTLYGEPVAASPGSPFVFTTAATLTATFAGRTKVTTGLNGTIVPGIAGSRIRVLTISFSLGGPPSSPIGLARSGVSWTIFDITTSVFIGGRVVPDFPFSFLPFPEGLDFPVSADVRYSTGPDFADTDFGLSVIYRVI